MSTKVWRRGNESVRSKRQKIIYVNDESTSSDRRDARVQFKQKFDKLYNESQEKSYIDDWRSRFSSLNVEELEKVEQELNSDTINYWMGILTYIYYHTHGKTISKFANVDSGIPQLCKDKRKQMDNGSMTWGKYRKDICKFGYTSAAGEKKLLYNESDLLIPYNANNNHWYLVHVHTGVRDNEQYIKIYDSLQRVSNVEKYKKDMKDLEPIINDRIKIEIMNVPQQTDKFRCGLYMLHFAECLIFGNNVNSIFNSILADYYKKVILHTIQKTDL